MGVVYQCLDPQIGRQVAIKTVLLETTAGGDTEDVKQRIFKEAQAAGVLSHPNIVTIFDVGEDGGNVYIVMEYLEGRPLDGIIKGTNGLQQRQVLSIVDQVGGALDFAHRKGIVHRDVKPANIMQTDDGRSILMDFGIAWMFDHHAAERGTLVGSPIYMSPEQINGDELTGASDIYSLAAVTFELLTGERPFAGKNFNEIVQAKYDNRRKSLQDLDPRLPSSLEGFFDKALAAKVSERYNTGKALMDAFKAALFSSMSSQSMMASHSQFTYTVREPLKEPDEPGEGAGTNAQMAKTMMMGQSERRESSLDQTTRMPFNQYQKPAPPPAEERETPEEKGARTHHPGLGTYQQAGQSQQSPAQHQPGQDSAPDNQGPAEGAVDLPGIDELDSTISRMEKDAGDADVREMIKEKSMALNFQRPEDTTIEGQRAIISELKMVLPMVDSRAGDSEFLVRVGSLYLRLAKYTEAMSFFKRAFKQDWECVDAYYAMGVIYNEYKMDDKAVDYWAIAEYLAERNVGKLSGKNSYRLGKKLEKMSIIRGAITVWEEAGAMEPWHLDTWRDLSRYYLQMKDYKRAMTALQHMVKLSKYDALAYRNLAVCYQNTKNYQKALETWEKALRLESRGEGANKARKQIAALKRILR